jgi:hypothetical protein
MIFLPYGPSPRKKIVANLDVMTVGPYHGEITKPGVLSQRRTSENRGSRTGKGN